MKRFDKTAGLALLATAAVLMLSHPVMAQHESMKMPMKMGTTEKQEIPPDLETSRSKSSEKEIFWIEYSPEESLVPLKKPHTWKLTVLSNVGKPVDGAEVTVDGTMPGHEHGMAMTLKGQNVRAMKSGFYLCEGMHFQMEGWWQVTFTVSHEGKSDKATFNIILP